MRKRSKPETVLQARIVEAIELAFPRAKVLRMNAGQVKVSGGVVQLAPKGFPDLMVLLPDAVCFLEVKTGDGEPTLEQRGWAEWFEESSHFHCVVRSQQQALDFLAGCA